MCCCYQTAGQSVLAHGHRVKAYLVDLIGYLKTGKQTETDWKIPEWLIEYREQILASLPSEDTLTEYTIYHDCGKPFCRTVDDAGKQHFPNHAQTSARIWRDLGGDEAICRLIEHDMDIHTLKAADIATFAALPEAPTLLLSGLAEIHANAEMFGGLQNPGFKSKWKHIDHRGQQICKMIFG